MPGKKTAPTAAAKTELAFSRLDSLSILPAVAAKFLDILSQIQVPTDPLCRIIRCDPALTAGILSIMHKESVSFAEENFSIHQAVEKLPPALVRDAFFSLNIVSSTQLHRQTAIAPKDLLLHSLAVACCAEEIAEIISPRINPNLAFTAGLLHDIGKIAIQQIMPKSFARIAEEAKSKNACSCEVEREYLGLPHTIIGKRLAQNWHLPDQIAMAAWLHHTDTAIITKNMPQAVIAAIVRLADLVARRAGIGLSGSYDSTDQIRICAQNLDIQPEQIRQIDEQLGAAVEEKSKILGLDAPEPESAYSQAIQVAATNLASENTKLAEQNQRLHIASGCLDFATDLLSEINPADSHLEIMKKFATLWQNYYQTGQLCIYLLPSAGHPAIEAVIVESPEKIETFCLNPPVEKHLLPPQISEEFAVLQVGYHLDWLFEQLESEFDLSRTKIIPLLSAGKVIGAVIFELSYPADGRQLERSFSATSQLGAYLLDMALAAKNQQTFAETFAELITAAPQVAPEPEIVQPTTPAPETQPQLLTALSEMAAGAAHELNNPLAVVAGRAQMLGKIETDVEKRKILKLINKNTYEISQIIDDLMGFAQPPTPRPTPTASEQIIAEAIDLTKQKTGIEDINIQVGIAEPDKTAFVDSAQIASAVANIFCNAIESYGDSPGPVKVTDAADKDTNYTKIIINDFGCGMDEETIEKATHPFFSAKPAGRKRGMGLAYADRLIQLNKGWLKIESKPASGTTVTISLPCK